MARAVIRATFTLGLCGALLSACSNAPPLRSISDINEWIAQGQDQNTKPEERKIGCELPRDYRLPDDFSLERHVLVSDSEGSVVPRDPEQKKGFDETFRTIMLGFAKEVERKEGKPPRLLFYFNGGLNSQAVVEEQAARQVPCLIADGYYPVFFVWDTDGVSTYWEQVTSVWDGQIYHDAVTRARTPLMVLGNLLSGIGQAPADYAIHGRRFWRALWREPACSLLLEPENSENCPIEQDVKYVDAGGKACLYQNVLNGRKKICPEQNVVVDDNPDERQREVH